MHLYMDSEPIAAYFVQQLWRFARPGDLDFSPWPENGTFTCVCHWESIQRMLNFSDPILELWPCT